MSAAESGFWAKFREDIWNDSVRPFIWMYYLPLLSYGLFSVVFPKATSIMDGTLGAFGSRLWVAACITMTITAMIGLGLRHGGTPLTEMTTPLLRQDYLGLGMQATGHAAMSLVLVALEIAALRCPYVWYLVPCVFAISSYVFGCLVLCLVCVGKVRKGRQMQRRR